MKNIFYLIPLILLIASSKAELSTHSQLILKDLSYQKKSKEQKINEFCSSKRTWVEFESKATYAVDIINKTIRKNITVDKELKASDCPQISEEKNLQENYSYFNDATPTGRLGGLLGVRELVYFPGGSGRVVVNFKSFDLKTGKVFNVNSCLKKGALEQIISKYCKILTENKAKLQINPDELKSECLAPQFEFVIENEGLNIATWTAKARTKILEEALISNSELNLYFKESCLPNY